VPKRLALGLTAGIILIGVLFIGLDILDIAEDFRLNISIALINTILICGVAALILYFSVRVYLSVGSPEMLGLACGALAFMIGFALYGWLTVADLNTRITAHDIGILLAGISLAGGAGLTMARLAMDTPGTMRKLLILSACCLVIIALIGILTWLASLGIINLLQAGRDLARGGAALLLLVSGCCYLLIYLKTRSDIYFWYSLGLILIACGVVFISQGALQSRTAWWGRVSEYAGMIYLLTAAIINSRHKTLDSSR